MSLSDPLPFPVGPAHTLSAPTPLLQRLAREFIATHWDYFATFFDPCDEGFLLLPEWRPELAGNYYWWTRGRYEMAQPLVTFLAARGYAVSGSLLSQPGELAIEGPLRVALGQLFARWLAADLQRSALDAEVARWTRLRWVRGTPPGQRAATTIAAAPAWRRWLLGTALVLTTYGLTYVLAKYRAE